MKYTYPIIFSLILLILISFFSILFSYLGILDARAWFDYAKLIAISFFIINIYREIDREKKEGINLFFKYIKSTAIIFFIFFFSVIGWHMIRSDPYKLYKYNNHPCKNVVFKTVNKMHLMAHNESFMPEGAYFITRNTLEENHRTIHTKYISKGKYLIGSKWRVIGFYHPYGPRGGGLKYFLVQSMEDNNIAWIASMNYNYQQCQPNFYSYETRFRDYPMYEPENNSTRILIDFTNLKIKPYK